MHIEISHCEVKFASLDQAFLIFFPHEISPGFCHRKFMRNRVESSKLFLGKLTLITFFFPENALRAEFWTAMGNGFLKNKNLHAGNRFEI